jgi:hypothetical protein
MTLESLGRLAPVTGLLLLLSACATVGESVPMKNEFWSQTDRSVSVALAKLPDTQPHRAGAQGLLDMAINEAMADELSKALKTITLTDSYGEARSEVVKRMQEKGLKASFVDKPLDVSALQEFRTEDKNRTYALLDYRPLKAEFGSDRLLVFTVVQVGTIRSYYGFIPTSRPSAILNARGELIDLQTNEVLWRDTTSNSAQIDDPWDQPPDFKNVDAAVRKVIADARKAMVEKLFTPAPGATAAK